MKAYTYKPADIGLNEWREGANLLRLDGVEAASPEEAEVFIVGGVMRGFGDRSSIDRLPYMAGREERHVFFDICEEYTNYNARCLFFRCTLHTNMLGADPNSIAWPWPVENLAECVEPPTDGFVSDVAFHGWMSCNTRRESTLACLDYPGLRCDIQRHSNFFGDPGFEHSAEGQRRKKEHWRSIRESRLVLCPESIPGDFPYRFFEAMSGGRVPVLVGSGQVFPFAAEIPYAEFILHVNPGESGQVGRIISNFVKNTSDEELIRKGKLARLYWQKYLNRDDWPKMMTYAVRKKFQEFGFLQ